MQIEISCESEITSIILNGEEIEVPQKQEGKYIIEKEVGENGTYSIIAKDTKGKFNIGKVEVKDITEDMDIYNLEDMVAFRNEVNIGRTYVGKTVRVKEDINLEGTEQNKWIPIANVNENGNLMFAGTFDGENHIISNLYINQEAGNQGLFAYNTGTIKNVTVSGKVTGNGYHVAGICARSIGTIENCTNSASVENKSTTQNQTAGVVARIEGKSTIKTCVNNATITSSIGNLGGVIGHSYSEEAIIENCINNGNIEGPGNVGGIMGSAQKNGTIQNCVNYGEIKAIQGTSVGGILGVLYESTNPMIVKNCINKAKIEASIWAAGGIVGSVTTLIEISQCRNEAEIFAGNGNAGGIVGSIGDDEGQNYTSSVEQCSNYGYVHATGNTGNPACGGILGTTQAGDSTNISNCYNSAKVESTSYTSEYIYHGVGGIVGTIYNNATKTTEKSKATVSNSYNIGNIANSYSTSYAGQIIGRDHNNNNEVTKCYYLNVASGTNTYGGTAVEESNLKNYVQTLGDSTWKADELDDKGKYKNNGFPILKWE